MPTQLAANPPPRSAWAAARRLLGLWRYARSAFELVWETDHRLCMRVLALTLTTGAIPAGVVYLGKLVIDGVTRAVTSGVTADRQHVLWLLAAELGLIASLLAAQRALSVCDGLLRVRLTQRVIELVLEKALSLDLPQFESPALYDLLRRVREQAAERPLSLVRHAMLGLQLSVSLVGYLGLVAAWSPWILALLIVAALPSVVAEARFDGDAFRLHRAHSPEARRQSYLETVLSRDDHAKEVRTLGLGALLLERHRVIFSEFHAQDHALSVHRGAWGFGLGLLSAAALAVSYAWVAWQAMAGVFSVGSFAMLLAVLRQGQSAISGLLLVIASMYDDQRYVALLDEFLALPSATTGGADAGPEPGDGLRFEGVEFSYPDSDAPTLRALDLHLVAGQTLAIVGRNGAGKSTLVKLALGLYTPTRGRVTLEGLDLRAWDKRALSARFSVLFQDYVRYQSTVGDNIGFGDIEHVADREKWTNAARRAALEELIAGLPNGYTTQLGHWFDSGHELSVGEWQRIALGRAFMKSDANIYVLDEPSASLDADAESEIVRQLSALTAGRSAIIISHRLATLRVANQILMFDKGVCVERGSHDELLAQSGQYAALFDKQAAGYR